MHQGRYVFTQLVDFLPRKHFEWLVTKYEGNKYVKSFSCWNHLLVLLFGQLSNREGLRDLIVTLTPFKFAFHHLGFGKSVTRSNLSKANEIREVRIFQEFADRMVAIAPSETGWCQGLLHIQQGLCIRLFYYFALFVCILVDETSSWQRWRKVA